jgi:DNA-binding transcriptional regulator GbsR (MarR family)
MYLKSLDPCYPSYSKIIEKTGLSKSSVQRAIKWMVDNNILKYEKGSHLSTSNRYSFIEDPVVSQNTDLCSQRIPPVVSQNTSLCSHRTPPLCSERTPNTTISLILQTNSTNKKEKVKRKKPEEAKAAIVDSKESTLTPLEVFNLWNKIVDEKSGLPKARALSDKQKRGIAKTSRMLFLAGSDWTLYFYSIYHSKFLLGANNRQWRACFDWAVNETNAAKVINGKYFEEKPNTEQKKSNVDFVNRALRIKEN